MTFWFLLSLFTYANFLTLQKSLKGSPGVGENWVTKNSDTFLSDLCFWWLQQFLNCLLKFLEAKMLFSCWVDHKGIAEIWRYLLPTANCHEFERVWAFFLEVCEEFGK